MVSCYCTSIAEMGSDCLPFCGPQILYAACLSMPFDMSITFKHRQSFSPSFKELLFSFEDSFHVSDAGARTVPCMLSLVTLGPPCHHASSQADGSNCNLPSPPPPPNQSNCHNFQQGSSLFLSRAQSYTRLVAQLLPYALGKRETCVPPA